MLIVAKQITGKAMMLDEIINYVQSLQRQVEVSEVSGLLFRNSIRNEPVGLMTEASKRMSVAHFFFFQFLSMKLSAISPELNCNLDLQDVRWQNSTPSRDKSTNVAAYSFHCPWIDLSFSGICRSFAHKMLSLPFPDTVRR